jgi:hypothetical protein
VKQRPLYLVDEFVASDTKRPAEAGRLPVDKTSVSESN